MSRGREGLLDFIHLVEYQTLLYSPVMFDRETILSCPPPPIPIPLTSIIPFYSFVPWLLPLFSFLISIQKLPSGPFLSLCFVLYLGNHGSNSLLPNPDPNISLGQLKSTTKQAYLPNTFSQNRNFPFGPCRAKSSSWNGRPQSTVATQTTTQTTWDEAAKTPKPARQH